MKNKKICFIASSGGHFEQLMMLKPLMEKYDSFVVTEKTKYQINIKQKHYYLKQVNRKELSFLFNMFINVVLSIRILLKVGLKIQDNSDKSCFQHILHIYHLMENYFRYVEYLNSFNH
jgi:hypothetical protein